MSDQIDIVAEEPQTELIPINPSELEQAKQRRRQVLKDQIDQARVFERLGSKVIKVRLKTYQALGLEVEKLGVKQVGHGKIAVSGDEAHVMASVLVDLVHQLKQKEPEKHAELIIEAAKEFRALNQQVMDSGKAHIEADKQANPDSKGQTLTIPFPAGTPIMVGVPQQKPVQVDGSNPSG